MKRFLLLFLLTSLSFSSYAQLDFDRNKTIDINLGYNNSGALTALRDNDVKGLSAFNIVLGCYGFYFTISANYTGDHSRNMGIDKYEGYRTRTYCIGYALPITDWFKIIPTLGIAKWESGYWNGADWYVDSEGIVNKFSPHYSNKSPDIGCILQFTIARYFNIYANVSNNNWGLGVGVSIPLGSS